MWVFDFGKKGVRILGSWEFFVGGRMGGVLVIWDLGRVLGRVFFMVVFLFVKWVE